MNETNPFALRGVRVTASVLLLASMTIMANATIAPSLPGLKAHFAGVDGIETLSAMLLTLPSLSIMLAAGPIGALADRVDRQKILAVSALLYALGGTSGLWAVTLPQMLIGRFILGIGVAGTMTLAMAWAADLWAGAARERYLGLQGAAMSAGGIVVMLAGGALAALHWRGAFAVYVIVVPVAALALMALAPENRRLLAERKERRESPAQSAPVEPFPWRVFALVGPLSFLFMVTFYIMPTRLPFLLEGIGVTNAAFVGAIMALMTLASVPGALLYGQVRRFLSPMAIFAWSYGLMGAGLILIGMAPGVWTVVLAVVIMGAGMGPSMPNYTTYMMASVPPSQRGRAAGLLTTSFFAGQFASPLVTAPLVTAFQLSGAFETMGVALLLLCVVIAIRAGTSRRMGQMTRPEAPVSDQPSRWPATIFRIPSSGT
ncbi:MAG: MFS transporter [Tabrizicola sp.]|nr:MFS transporter [Tabrizicola sp.]